MTDWQRFTPAARRAVALAETFARRHGEIERFPDPDLTLGVVTADHLLLGIANPAVEVEIWDRLGLGAAEVHAVLERALAGGIWPPTPTDTPSTARADPADVLLDESAQVAVEFAVAEARRLRHPDVRPEHLLLGVLRAGRASRRAPESLGVLVLSELNVTLARVFALLLASDAEAGTGRYAPRPSPFDA